MDTPVLTACLYLGIGIIIGFFISAGISAFMLAPVRDKVFERDLEEAYEKGWKECEAEWRAGRLK